MWTIVATLFRSAARDFRGALRGLAIADVVYKAIAFAVLTPAVTWILYLLRAGTPNRVVADVDIAWFFLTTPAGIATLIFGVALIVAITAIQSACLMAFGLSMAQGVKLDATSALRFGAAQAFPVLRLVLQMVLRILMGAAPFVLAAGAVYLLLLRDQDINYYLARHPPEFWIAAVLVALIASGFVYLLARTIARWALAMPLVLFEKVNPRHALRESAKRAVGSYGLIIATLTAWALFAVLLSATVQWFIHFIGSAIAPQLAGSLAALLLFIAVLVLIGFLLVLAVGIVNFSLFALLITHLYLRIGAPTLPQEPIARGASAVSRKLSSRERMGVVAFLMLVTLGVGLFAFLTNRNEHPALIIAHRGSSALAPENTLAAFRLAGDQRTDFVELDVQESSDGQVLVVHDSDLMKVGGHASKIWDEDAATLRTVDIGSFKDPKFSAERVPTLAEALAACKGRCRVIVELKSYGHNQRLEERVVNIVEAAGMENDCVFMSLDHDMVAKMKELRPSWRAGLLVAKAMGDLTELKADFLAVEARMASRQFVRRAHRAGQDVYIWTVNDPAWMFVGLSRGVDGLITDKPDIARQVIATHAQMSQLQRFVTALLIQMGASTQALEAETALRP